MINDIILTCKSCNNTQITEPTGNEPIGTVTIMSNYCPKCESEHQGDYYVEYYLDGMLNEIYEL